MYSTYKKTTTNVQDCREADKQAHPTHTDFLEEKALQYPGCMGAEESWRWALLSSKKTD
jgi:hypothetical protein